MFRLETSIPSLIGRMDGWMVGWSVFKKKSSIYLTLNRTSKINLKQNLKLNPKKNEKI